MKGGIIPEKEGNGEIRFEKVKFNYPTKAEVKVLEDISITIQKKKVIALVGTSGCGKSSMISLIERFYDP